MFGLTFERIILKRIKFKKVLLDKLFLKELIFIWFKYVKSKFKRMIFI